MAEQGIDVLMAVTKTSKPLPAEAATKIGIGVSTLDEQMLVGFSTGYFCELREFSFSAGVASKKSKEEGMTELEKEDRRKRKLEASREREESMKRMDAIGQLRARTSLIERKQDKSASKRNSNKDVVDMQPVEFSRVMDMMSPALFQSLVDCDTLAQLSVAKRKASGSQNAGEIYLRLDFERVLLTNLDWKDSDHLILETGTFIYRKVTIRYRPQKSDGSLGLIVRSEWEMKPISANQAATGKI